MFVKFAGFLSETLLRYHRGEVMARGLECGS